ncbi:MAG: VWA domain-containing protein [Saprospiraceae bacterium]|nr:VWA domain-containing protein [Saprospiraceae bacterium]
MKTSWIVILMVLLLNPILAQDTQKEDKTLSPYFMIVGGQQGVDQLPLLSTSADVNIAGVIADVTITQVYKNDGQKPIEAIYVFPASTRAAVYDMVMKIGNRTIQAEIKEKNQAKAEYEQAKADGKRVSLLEQERPNVFQMNVANLMSGDRIEVVLKYTEMLVPENGIYEFVYPTVVGPRYNESSGAEAQFVANPYQKSGEAPLYDFDIDIYLSAGLPIQNITSTTHKVGISYEGQKAAEIALDKSEKNGGNRDFILQYQLTGGEIESGMLLYEHKGENYFLTMVQPPKRVIPKHIPAREYIFIVDVSGSMRGFPLNISKKLLRNLIVGLRPSDRFNVLLFSGNAGWLAEESIAATEENIDKAISVINRQYGGGGTRLLPAMQKALAMPRFADDLSRSMVVVTDGYISVEQETFDLIRNRLNEANLFTFGIGAGVNRHLLEGMAHVGMGEPLIITAPEGAHEKAEAFRQYISQPVLSQVNIAFEGFEAYDIQPSSVPDVLADRPILVFGKYKGEPKGKIRIKGHTGTGAFEKVFDVEEYRPSRKNGALRYLWAREKIRLLDDYNQVSYSDERIAEVTQLGLDYNLMTAYTSFIAVDNEVVKNEDGEIVSVKQALPLPSGVENTAIGFDVAIEGVVRKNKAPKARPLKLTVQKTQSGLGQSVDQLLQEELQTYLDQLSLCPIAGQLDTIEMAITLDVLGRILSVEVVNGDEALTKCLQVSLEKHYLFSCFHTQQITLAFTLKAQEGYSK